MFDQQDQTPVQGHYDYNRAQAADINRVTALEADPILTLEQKVLYELQAMRLLLNILKRR